MGVGWGEALVAVVPGRGSRRWRGESRMWRGERTLHNLGVRCRRAGRCWAASAARGRSLLQYNGEQERVRRIVDRALGEGFKQIKLHERTADAVAAARGVAGPGVPLMVDTNCAWLPADAVAAVAEMAPSDLLWIEEPIWPPEDFASLAALRHATGVATAIGENASNALDFRKMLADDCVDYVQPSVIKIGGLTPLWRICTEFGSGRNNLRSPLAILRPGLSRDHPCAGSQGARERPGTILLRSCLRSLRRLRADCGRFYRCPRWAGSRR